MMLTGLGYSKDFFQISHDDGRKYIQVLSFQNLKNDSRYDMQPVPAGYHLERL